MTTAPASINCVFIGMDGSIRVTGTEDRKEAREAAMKFAKAHKMPDNITLSVGSYDTWDYAEPQPAYWQNGFCFYERDKG